jgi:hypothetical protein
VNHVLLPSIQGDVSAAERQSAETASPEPIAKCVPGEGSEVMLVLQDWVNQVGLKMQSILLSGFRAPDQNTKAVKMCIRWLRAHCQINADPSKMSYMRKINMSKHLIDQAMDEAEYLPVHYVHHLADSFRVLGIFHPEKEVQLLAKYLHYQVAEELFHFIPETEEVFLKRHRDKIDSIPKCESCGTEDRDIITCPVCGAQICRACFYTEQCERCIL